MRSVVRKNISLPALDKDTAEKLVATAHTVCPYSKATRGNIDVLLKVNDQALPKAALTNRRVWPILMLNKRASKQPRSAGRLLHPDILEKRMKNEKNYDGFWLLLAIVVMLAIPPAVGYMVMPPASGISLHADGSATH